MSDRKKIIKNPIIKELEFIHNDLVGTVIWDLESLDLMANDRKQQKAFNFIRQMCAMYCDNHLDVREVFGRSCKIPPYAVPNPVSLLINKQTTGMHRGPSHYQVMCQWDEIDRHYLKRGPHAYIGWNTDHFDEELYRYDRFKTLFDPYSHVKYGNFQIDAIKAMHMIINFYPNFHYSLTEKGNPETNLAATLKYFDLHNANPHDAHADVNATRSILRYFARHYPLIYESLIINGSKKGTLAMLEKFDVCLLGELTPEKTLSPLSFLFDGHDVQTRKKTNDILTFNLEFDPSEINFDKISSDDLVEIISKSAKNKDQKSLIRVLKKNKTQPLVPLKYLDAGEKLVSDQFKIPVSELKRRAEFISQNRKVLFEKLLWAYQIWLKKENESFDNNYEESEQKLYENFISAYDADLMDTFHNSSWAKKWKIASEFRDPRLADFAKRILCEHNLDYASDDVLIWWQKFLDKRLHEEGYGLTVVEAKKLTSEIIKNDSLPDKKNTPIDMFQDYRHFNNLQDFYKNIENRIGDVFSKKE